MLQSGNLEVYNTNLGSGNLNSRTGVLSSAGRGLSGPTTYISVESDPIFSSSPAGGITNEDIERWNQSSYDLVSYYVTKDEITQMSYVTNETLNETLSSYATITYVNSYVSYSLQNIDTSDIDLSSYVTKSELSECGYVTLNDIPYIDLSSYVSDDELVQLLNSYITDSELSEILSSYATQNYTYTNYVSYTYLGDLNEIIDYILGTGDPSSPENLYATRQELETLLLTYATKNYVDTAILNAEIGGGDVTIDLSYYLRKDELPSYLISYVTKNELNSYVSKTELNNMSYVDNAQLQGQLQASSYATQNYVNSNFPSYAYVLDKINSITPGGSVDLSSYVTKDELSNCGYATQSYVMDKINSIPSSGGNTYISYNTYSTSIWQGTLSQYQGLSDHITYQLYLIAQE